MVSIITPCYNGEKFVARFFESILNQTYTNMEVIFINDGSKDQTEEIALNYKKKFEKKGIPFLYQYQENAGQAAALNKGLKLFHGEYLFWPDSDDEVNPQFIEAVLTFFKNNPSCMFCHGKYIEVDDNNPGKASQITNTEIVEDNGDYDFFESILYLKNHATFPGFIVRTKALHHCIHNREIYSGRGGQNAQILLPFGWYYGKPGYVEKAVYTLHLRKNSHSHSIDTSEKVIRQFYNYENIITATIKNIADPEAEKFITKAHNYYTKLRFGNAVDTKNPDLIRSQYKELKETGEQSFHDWALYMKYTNKIMRKLLHVRSVEE